jgi:acetoin utilization protein AcuB
MRVSEVMSGNVATIDSQASCHEAVMRMHQKRVRHLPVVDVNGDLVGVVTDRDLRHRLFSPAAWQRIGSVPVAELLRAVPVRDVMSSPVVTVEPDDELEAAARVMLEDKVGSLPVVQRGRVVGMLTETDMLRRIVHADSRCEEVESIIVSYP